MSVRSVDSVPDIGTGMSTLGFKVVTHDLCPPIQGGPPLWDGALPHLLPAVHLDTGPDECSAGWNYCERLSTALRIAGLWPTGRPSRGFLVEAGPDAIVRGDKRRASRLTIVRETTEDELDAAILELSAPFGVHAERMAAEQIEWRRALSRPERNPAAVAGHLTVALTTRGLTGWQVQEFPSAWDAWDAWAAWDTRAARAAWDTWDAWDARAALTVTYAAVRGWIDQQPELLTTGIRDAYGAGLAVAIPAGPRTLGYALVKSPAIPVIGESRG